MATTTAGRAKRAAVAAAAPWDAATGVLGVGAFGVRMVRDSAPPVDSCPYRGRAIRSPRDAADVLGPVLGVEPNETVAVLVLDGRHNLMAPPVVVSRGTVNTALLTPALVFRPALLLNGASVVVAHNHPSGDPSPSPDDRAMGDSLGKAGRVLDVPVMDWLVIGRRVPAGADGRWLYVSASESGWL